MERCEETLVFLLQKKGYFISTAESCTGGMVAEKIVSVPGASNVFEEGFVTYSDRAKNKILSVPVEILEKYTAVSREAALLMAQGLYVRTGAQLTVSVTGYAGPKDAYDGTKAGTVYIGTCLLGKAAAKKFIFSGDRQEVRVQAADHALAFACERMGEIV